MLEVGQVSSIDSVRRVQRGAYELFIPLAEARVRMRRPPDHEDDQLVSWGRLSVDEVHRLTADDEETRAELLRESSTSVLTLHYPGSFRVQ